MTRVLGYLRVSTNEQADSGAGVAAQRSAILAEAERRGWGEVTFIEDLGYSGKDMHRPGVQAALDALRTHRADVLVVSRLDRLSRSLLDFAQLMQVSTREKWSLVALDLGVDTSSISGRAVASVVAVFSELERGLIAARTREALAARKASGVKLGRPRVMDPAVRESIGKMRDAGMTFAGIAAVLNEQGTPTARGGAKWYAATVRAALRPG